MFGLLYDCNASASGVIVSAGRLLLEPACVANRKLGVGKRDWPALIPLETYVPVNWLLVLVAKSQLNWFQLATGICAFGSGVKRYGRAAARPEPSVARCGPPLSSLAGSPGFSPWRMIITKAGGLVVIVVILFWED